MSKTLLFFCLAMLAFLGIGVAVAPNSSLFLLATDGSGLQHVRIVIGTILAIQLVTRPPRHVWFRILAGAVAVTTGVWAIQETYSYNLQLLDSLAFLGASFAIFATAMERSLSTLPSFTIRNKTIVS